MGITMKKILIAILSSTFIFLYANTYAETISCLAAKDFVDKIEKWKFSEWCWKSSTQHDASSLEEPPIFCNNYSSDIIFSFTTLIVKINPSDNSVDCEYQLDNKTVTKTRKVVVDAMNLDHTKWQHDGDTQMEAYYECTTTAGNPEKCNFQRMTPCNY